MLIIIHGGINFKTAESITNTNKMIDGKLHVIDIYPF